MAAEISSVSYEDLADIEDDFEAIDVEIMRRQYELSIPIYAKRAEAVAKVENFWPLVFEQAPLEIDQFIQPQDSSILGEHLKQFTVTRPELERDGNTGNPRSLRFKFEFSPNAHFEDTVLEKTFWYRRASDGWTGLVSEPVKIRWKKGKDLTQGLTDAAAALWDERTKVGDMKAQGVPEYKALEKKVEHWNGGNTSFFAWFGWVSNRRWVSAEESKMANEKYQEQKRLKQSGADVAAADEEAGMLDEEADDDQAVEVHPAGEDIAIALAEELWPSAIKFFTQAQESEEMSDADFEEDDMDDGDADGDDDQPVDIRSLVQGKEKARSRDSGGPPMKKMKK